MSTIKVNRSKQQHSLTILIVEDYLVFARSVRKSLPEHDFVFAQSVEEAIAQYQKTLPDITFLDIHLPDGSGFEALSAIKNFDPNAYIVMLTGNAQEEFVRQSHAEGVRGYIVKPPTRATLEQHISYYYKYLETASKKKPEIQKAVAGVKTEVKPRVEKPEMFQKDEEPEKLSENKVLNGLNILFMESFEANRHRFTFEFEKSGGRVVAVENMQEALEEIAGKRYYQLVIVDCTIPDDEAYLLTKEIRSIDKKKKKKRFIIGLGKDFKEDSDKWLIAGMNDYFRKPVQLLTLQEYIISRLDEIMNEQYLD